MSEEKSVCHKRDHAREDLASCVFHMHLDSYSFSLQNCWGLRVLTLTLGSWNMLEKLQHPGMSPAAFFFFSLSLCLPPPHHFLPGVGTANSQCS